MHALSRPLCSALLLLLAGFLPGAAMGQVEVIPPPQNAEAFDPHRFLLGSWRNATPLPVEGATPGQVDLHMTITFEERGVLQGVGTMHFPPEPGYEHVQRDTYQIETRGTWSVTPSRSWEMKLTGTGTIVTSNPGADFRVEEPWAVNQVVWIRDQDTYLDSDGVRWQRVLAGSR